MSKNNIRHFKRSALFLAIAQIGLITHAQAAPCEVTNRSLITQVSGECIVNPTRADPNPVQPDSVILKYTRNHDMLVEGDVGPPGLDQFWNDLTIKGEGAGQKVLEIFSVGGIGSATPYQSDNRRKTITTSKLTLDNVALESNVVFKFNQASNALTLKNSEVYWHLRDPIFQSGTNLTVTSESGDNTWKGLTGTTVPADVDWNIKSGSTFEFFGSGSSSGGALKFDGQNNINVESNSTLRFHESVIDFGSNSVLNLADSTSDLRFRTSDTKISVDTLNSNGGTINYEGGFISFLPTTANLDNTSISLSTGHLETKRLVLSGTNDVTGDRSIDYLRAEVIQTKDTTSPTILNATHLNQIRAETLLLTPNLTINLDSASLRMLTGSDLRLQGGTINVDNRGVIGAFGQITGNDATININNGDFVVGQTAELILGPSLNLSLNSVDTAVTVEGRLSGSGTIGGTGGRIDIQGDSNLTPTLGVLDLGTASDPYGTLTTENQVRFVNSLVTNSQTAIDSGLFDGGYYDVDIGLTGGTTAVNDKIVYGDGGVDLTLMKSIRLDVADNSTAAQLHQKSFRIIEARSGATGNVVMQGQDIATDLVIEEGPNVPILIDFFIDDDAAFSGDDVTIYAEEQSLFSLKKHPGVAARRNRQSVTNILPTVATNPTPPPSTPGNPQPPAQTPAQQQAQQNVFNAVQTTTNSQAAPSFSSIHPEPISSQMTVQIEQADNMLNTILGVNTLARDTEVDLQNYGSFFFGSSNSHPSGVWANINYIDGKVDGQGDLGNFDYYLTSYTFGNSFIHHNDYELGLFFGLSNESMTEHDQANVSFDSDAYHIGLYGGYRLNDRWDLIWGLGHAWLTTESSRSTTLGSISETAEAEYDSQLNYLGLRARYDTSWLEQVDSSAYIGLAYLRADQDEFSETNAPNLGMTIDRAIVSSGIISLGMEASRALNEFDSTHMRTELRYDYDVQADSNSEHDISASFNFDPSNTQSFVGQNRGPHSLTFALGVDHEFQEDWLLSLAGAYTRSSHGYEIGGDIVMNWYW